MDPYKVIRIKSSNSDFAYTLFKSSIFKQTTNTTQDPHTIISASVIYVCVPFLKMDLKVEMIITVPGCDPVTIFWIKICGNILTPVPGFYGWLDTPKFKNIQVIWEGLFDVSDPW